MKPPSSDWPKRAVNRVLTADRRDFSVYRTPSGQPFERVWLADGG